MRLCRGRQAHRERPIGEEHRDRVPELHWFANSREHSRLVVIDHFGNAAGARCRDWLAEDERIEQDGAHSLFPGAEYGHVGGREKCVGIVAVSRQVQGLPKPQSADCLDDVPMERAVANEQRLEIRHA